MLGQRRGGGPGPERRMAGTSGRLAVRCGSWPADKGSAPRKREGKGDMAAELRSGLAQHPITRFGGHCRTRWDAEWESTKAHSSAPLQHPKSPPVPTHMDFCEGRAHNLEQVANFYQQWDSSSAEKVT